ncbi:ubiquinol-cytochrome c reductase subunit 8 [Kwoniella heveanensis CBS 569]|uniref:Cytochrome b-c1 complex subunit 8 n=1 Tax=Kwoniella heveanensis BCC8398 TaxID=1296120 RepID=A0A1B9GY90_9TREE|nr:ubiquinol-cytochrome c reductase subunit 8 [Kwoniella heveanensis BCC8398]OCF45543.1 ubiquinol-cytochrome c reductase subunit 8 [Kwoniella heveanensis CBS 569]
MRPSAPAQSHMPGPKTYIGWWGDMGSLPQKGIKTYGVSPYRQRPFAGALNGYIFNGYRRVMNHMPYVVPPFLFFYGVYYWSTHKYAYNNSKQGHYDRLVEEGHIKPGEYERPTVGPIGH